MSAVEHMNFNICVARLHNCMSWMGFMEKCGGAGAATYVFQLPCRASGRVCVAAEPAGSGERGSDDVPAWQCPISPSAAAAAAAAATAGDASRCCALGYAHSASARSIAYCYTCSCSGPAAAATLASSSTQCSNAGATNAAATVTCAS